MSLNFIKSISHRDGRKLAVEVGLPILHTYERSYLP